MPAPAPPPDPLIVDTGGALPPFHPESAVFFANLLGLFFGNQAKTDLLNQTVSGIDSYGGRLVPIIDLLFTGRGNALVLERPPDTALCSYFRDSLGLSLPEIRTLTHSDYLAAGQALLAGDLSTAARLLGSFPPHSSLVDGFVTDPDLVRIAAFLGKRTVSSAPGSLRGNNKYLLHKHLKTSGLPVFDTLEANSHADLPPCLRALAASGFKNAVVKAPVGASGIGIAKIPTGAPPELVDSIPPSLFGDGPCMVQGWMEPGVFDISEVCSPSVQLFLDQSSVHLYDITEQILGHDSVHEGNVSPPPYLNLDPHLKRDLLSQAAEAGRWLHHQGYRGTASADFLVTYFGGHRHPEARICEINARVTGATYPALLAHHFIPHGAWLMRNLTFTTPVPGDYLLTLLDSFSHLFHPDQHGAGVLPINFVTGPSGLVVKGQFLCLADTPERCLPLFDLLRGDLPVAWDYSRD